MLFSNTNQNLQNQNVSLPWDLENANLNRVIRETASFSSTDDPQIVFFPSTQGGSSSNACQDAISTKGQSGFNTFAFLSFSLTIFNVMR